MTDPSAGASIRDAADRTLQRAITPAVRMAADAGWIDASGWAEIEAAGLPLALLDESDGGFGIPVADALSLLLVAGRHAMPWPLADTMLASWLLARAGVRRPPGPLGLAPMVDARIGGGRVAGVAFDVGWGRAVAGVVVVCGADLVLIGRDGYEVEEAVDIAGAPLDTLRFDTVADVVPSPVSAAWLRAAGAASRVQMIAGALARVSEMSVQYANERMQFGRPIGRLQAVQQNLAVLAGQAASAGAAADIAAEAVASGGCDLEMSVAVAKVRAGEAAGAGAAIAHQVHGAIGYAREHALGEYTRRLWAWRDQWGREAEWARALGRRMAAAGPEGLWPMIAAL